MKKSILNMYPTKVHKKFCVKVKETLYGIKNKTLLPILLIMYLQTAIYAQDTISLTVSDKPVKEVLSKIEKNSDYKFVYKVNDVDLERKVTINVDQEPISSVLEDIFESTTTEYKILDKRTFLTKKVQQNETPRRETKQSKPIRGKVTDENGTPLPGVTILVKGTLQGTSTDSDGNFSVSADVGSELQVSFIGFKTQTVTIGRQSTIDVVLEEDVAKLEELVVIGYGSVAKKELTGSASNAENIENRAVTNVGEALQGNVSGVTVLSDGGDPTSTPQIKIRGIGTTSEEQPLWIVDGVPYYGGPLNPSDIESMTVLKDAASASIYGVRAAGGVILVTTKKGTLGKTQFEFGSFMGVQNVYNKPQSLNAQEYTDYYNLAYDNSGTPRVNYFDGATNPSRLVNATNWVDEIFQSGFIQNYDISARGGSKKYTYFSSIGYNKKEGILINTYADRITFRHNSTLRLHEKVKLGQTFSFIYNNGQSAFTGTQASNGETNYNGIIAAAIKAPPFIPIYNDDGEYSNIADGNNGDVIHPVATLNRIDISNPQRNTFGNLFLEYNPIESLTLKSNFGINYTSELFEEFEPRVPELSKLNSTQNTLTKVDSEELNWSWENTINYQKVFSEDHSFQILGGYALQFRKYEWDRIVGIGFENESSALIAIPLAESIQEVRNFYEEETLVSFFSRALYDYKKKYFLSASIRRDGTSKLVEGKRWENFPSVGLGWRISEEDFFQLDVIDNFKLRASWGQVGNIESLSAYPTNVPLSVENIVLGGQEYQKGIVLDGRSNPDITWEISETTNLGLDMVMFNSRFNLTADYFIKNTNRLLIRIPTSPLEGISESPFQNSGKVRNNGIELGLGYSKYEGDFKYNISGNISFIKNEIIELSDGIDIIPEGETQVATHYPLANAVGQPIYSFYLIETDGLLRTDEALNEARENGQPDAQLGDVKFIDQDGDKSINDDDRVFKGSVFPKTTYGLNASFEYKNFDLALFFQGTTGGVAYNGFKFTATYPAHTSVAGANLSDVAKDTWHSENTSASNPRLSIDDPNGNISQSDFWLEKTDYLRLKNLSIGYTFPSIDKYFEKIRIYATAQNLLTWTKYSGLDPEVSNRGIDGGQYPISRVFTLGFNVTF